MDKGRDEVANAVVVNAIEQGKGKGRSSRSRSRRSRRSRSRGSRRSRSWGSMATVKGGHGPPVVKGKGKGTRACAERTCPPVVKGKGMSSLRDVTRWSQNCASADLVLAIAEAARELALRADREEVD